MVWGKQWCLGLIAVVVVVAAFGSLVGVSCWHMAYQEASLEAAVREQRTLDFAKKSCSAYVAKMLQQQQQLTTVSETSESDEQTTVKSQPAVSYSPSVKENLDGLQAGKVMIGLLTSRDVVMYTAQEAIQDLVQGGFITLEPQLASPPREPQTLVGYIERLHRTLGVRVFVGELTGEEVGEVAAWARERPRPRHPAVLILPSAPTGWWSASLEEYLQDDFAVILMTPSPTDVLPATLLQMRERGIKRVLPLMPDSANILATLLASWNLSSLNMKVLELVRYNTSVPVEEVVAAAGAVLQAEGSDAVGVLLTAVPNLVDMVAAAVSHQLLRVPWFIAANNLPNHLLDVKKSLLSDLDLYVVEYHENPVYTAARYENVSRRVEEKVESTPKQVSIAQVYDAVVVASRVGYWLLKEESTSLTEALRRVSGESSAWAGLTGVLELTENLERSQGRFTCFHLATGDSVRWEATGRIDVRRSAHTITLSSSSADTYAIQVDERSKQNLPATT